LNKLANLAAFHDDVESLCELALSLLALAALGESQNPNAPAVKPEADEDWRR
jgi:hypothetical protein